MQATYYQCYSILMIYLLWIYTRICSMQRVIVTVNSTCSSCPTATDARELINSSTREEISTKELISSALISYQFYNSTLHTLWDFGYFIYLFSSRLAKSTNTTKKLVKTIIAILVLILHKLSVLVS